MLLQGSQMLWHHCSHRSCDVGIVGTRDTARCQSHHRCLLSATEKIFKTNDPDVHFFIRPLPSLLHESQFCILICHSRLYFLSASSLFLVSIPLRFFDDCSLCWSKRYNLRLCDVYLPVISISFLLPFPLINALKLIPKSMIIHFRFDYGNF